MMYNLQKRSIFSHYYTITIYNKFNNNDSGELYDNICSLQKTLKRTTEIYKC